ncbi:Zn-dependent alcohol dehydrogenase [Actinorugispora endophytica]|uniref:S-(Hydroxymethyl)glutathione dehydrogenase/alcohol dehydrogenase n=1 Tax=Actinorugispora endophytica TaxID=1605990 RepID=A0A4R6UI57_9ACTN|nr:Zn-dependent alcohol dehydrogenase [Actinorugispora endophytica]TDQ45736.1 S-(hydroxymethyl)glutathione dehydrogenase/alcohol dehydrogenase [Actinorugispora endophytica]
MHTTLGAVLRAPGGPLSVEEITLPGLGPDDVRVRMAATGVCHSDLSLADGTLAHAVPVVLGHEGAGHVAEVGGAVTDLSVGDAVLLNWNPPCRTCWHCVNGEPYLCANAAEASRRVWGTLADGTPVHPGLGVAAFSQETVVPAASCLVVPDDVPPAQAALLGCAVLTGVGAVRNAAGVRPGESVAVIGLGGVGLSVVQGARIAGASTIIAVDPAAEKEELARSMGATHFLAPGDDLSRRIRAIADGRGVDHAIECVGRAATIRAAWSATRRGGKATVVGFGAATDELSFNALEITHFARALQGSLYGSSDPAVEVPELLRLYREGELDLSALVTRTIGLHEVEEAFADMRSGRGARSLVLF